jgi:hypothetical protein
MVRRHSRPTGLPQFAKLAGIVFDLLLTALGNPLDVEDTPAVAAEPVTPDGGQARRHGRKTDTSWPVGSPSCVVQWSDRNASISASFSALEAGSAVHLHPPSGAPMSFTIMSRFDRLRMGAAGIKWIVGGQICGWASG